ncbi:MAG: sel1 repeat family protein [Azonexaceae bacterium]|nr:sel1 repeat family protein [Azonexaceae bacterium]
MTIDQRGQGEALLIEAGALLRLSSDTRSHERAFALALQAVNSGAVDGHAILAHMYEYGLGTRRHLPKATKHYALAAIHGNTKADRTWGWLMALEGFLWHRGDAFSRY